MKSLETNPLPSAASFQEVVLMVIRGEIPAFEPGPLSHTLLLALERCRDVLPPVDHAAILGVAAALKKLQYDQTMGDIEAQVAVKNAMAARQGGIQ